MGIFVYHPDASDLSTTGLIGDLQAIECTFEEQRNGVSRLSMQLAYDTHEKWRAVEKGCLIKAPVLSRVPPVISGNALASSVNEYSLATNAARVFLYLRDGTKWAEVPQWYRSESTLKFYRIGDEKTINGAAMIQVFVVLPSGTGWVNCTGYIRKDMLSNATSRSIPQTINGLEAVTEASRLSYQLFTVVDKEETLNAVTVSCEHIFYELVTNYTEWTPAENTEYTGAQACAQVMDNLFSPDDQFSVRSDAATAMRGSRIDVARKNAVESFLDPESGVCALYGLSAIRDNYDVYLIENAETDRGFVVEYAKNMLGVQRNEGIQNVVTRIFPYGHDSNGELIWLDGTRYIDSQHVGDYRRPRVELFDTGLTIGKDGVTENNILSKIRQEGQKRFTADHADIPEVSMTVEFISLGDTEEYTQYRGLDRVYLLDRIAVRDKVRGYQYSAQVIGIKYNVLKEILESVVIGTVANWNGARKIARWQVPEISGDNIRLKSILAGSFDIGAIQGDDIAEGGVQWVHIDAASVGTLEADQLAALQASIHELIAHSITADDIVAGSITSREIHTGAITTEKIDAYAVTAKKLAVGAVTADNIDAESVRAAIISAGKITSADIEAGTITAANIDADNFTVGYAAIVDAEIERLIAQDAVTLKYYIEKLQVTNAQLVYATVGELVIKASDGKYYRLDVDSSGHISPTDVTQDLSGGEIAAGITSDGKSTIIETDIDVQDLSASSVKAINALIDQITASRIDVDELFAREATISKINVLDLSSNTYIQATIGDWNSGSTITQTIDSLDSRISELGYGTVFMQPNEPDHSNLVAGDIWIQTAANGTWNDVKNDTTYTSWNLIKNGNSQANPPILPIASWQVLGSIPVMYVWDGVRFVEMYDSLLPTSVETQIQQLSTAISLRATQADLDILTDEVSEFNARLTVQADEIESAVSAVNAKAATYVSWIDPTTLYTVTLGDIWIKRDEDFQSWQEIKDNYETWNTVYVTHDRWLDGLGDRSYIWNGSEWVLTADYAEELYQRTEINQNSMSISLLAQTTAYINNDLYALQAQLTVANDRIVAEVERATTAEGGLLDYVGTHTYALVSGIEIVAAGITVSGAQYVVIQSGGYFQVKTGDFSIDTNSATYVMWAGAGTASNAPFWLKKDGSIKSTSGTIGGFTIGANALSSGSTTSHVELSNTGDYAFWCGAVSAASAPFSVKKTGVMKATSGTIGGFNIGTNLLYSGSGTSYIALDSNANDTYAFWCGNSSVANAPFRLARDGSVTLTKLKTFGSDGTTEVDVNLKTAGLWKIGGSYKTINTVTSSGGYVTQMTLSNGDTVNFKSAASVTLDTSGGGSGLSYNTTYATYSSGQIHITVTAALTNGTNPSGALNITDRSGSGLAYDAGRNSVDTGSVNLNVTATTNHSGYCDYTVTLENGKIIRGTNSVSWTPVN